jgi:hypothetical protein
MKYSSIYYTDVTDQRHTPDTLPTEGRVRPQANLNTEEKRQPVYV